MTAEHDEHRNLLERGDEAARIAADMEHVGLMKHATLDFDGEVVPNSE